MSQRSGRIGHPTQAQGPAGDTGACTDDFDDLITDSDIATLCAGIDGCNDPTMPLLTPCAEMVAGTTQFCARHAEQADRQIALLRVLSPEWLVALYGDSMKFATTRGRGKIARKLAAHTRPPVESSRLTPRTGKRTPSPRHAAPASDNNDLDLDAMLAPFVSP